MATTTAASVTTPRRLVGRRAQSVTGAPLHVVVLLLTFVVGIALRLRGYSSSLNGDELSTYFIVNGHGTADIVRFVQGEQEATPPLYLVLAGWTQELGDPQDALRMVPFACGALVIPLIWLLGVRALDRRAAVVGAAIAALSPFLIFFASEARAYSLAMTLVLGSSLALLKAVRDGSRKAWALYALCTCGAMYTHYTTAFALFAQVIWALAYHRKAWRWLIGANAAAVVAWLPWLTSYQADQRSPTAGLIGYLQPFGWSAFKTDVLHWAIGHPITAFSVRTMPGDIALALAAFGLGVGLAGGARELVRRGVRRPGDGLALVLVLAAATPLLGGLYSAVDVSVFQPRNLISSAPGLMLALGWIVTRPSSPRGRTLATALLLAAFAIGAVRMQTNDAQRPDYKGVARFIAERGGPDAVVADVPGPSPGPFTQLDVPMAPGVVIPRRNTMLRIDRPTLDAQLEVSRLGGIGQYAQPPKTDPVQVARDAVRLARGGPIFFVNPGEKPFALVVKFEIGRMTPVGRFLGALPRGYRAVETRRYKGFFGVLPVTVYVLRNTAVGG